MGHSAKKKQKDRFVTKRNSPPRRSDADRRVRQAEHYGRLIRLLELLQSRLAYNVSALAHELGVSTRTVHRDLIVLELAGIPWFYDKEAGRYCLRDDFRFPVLCLTEEELIGQATAAALSSAPGLDINPGADPTIRKLRATGRGSTRKILEEARRLVAVLDLKLADHSSRKEQLCAIQRALIDRKRLGGEYRSPYQDAAKTLVLHPYRLCLVKQAWYLIARPDGSDRPLTYRVARFSSLKVLDDPALVPEEFDPRAYFGNAWAVYRGEHTFDVEVRFTREASAIVTETIWHGTQRVHQNEDGSVTLSFRVDGLDEITHWLVGWPGSVQILRPLELRERVVERWRRGVALNAEA